MTQTGENPPVIQPEKGKEQRGTQDDTHRPPAVEGVEQAHHSFLVRERAGLDDGAAEHLDETASHRIDGNAQQDANQSPLCDKSCT